MKIDWSTTQVRLKQMGRVRCEPGWALQASWSERLPDFDLWFVAQGTGKMRMHRETIELRPGVCFWMRPGGLYEGTQNLDDPLTVSYAHFDLLDMDGNPRPTDEPLPPEVILSLDIHFVDTLLRRLASTPLVNHTTAGKAVERENSGHDSSSHDSSSKSSAVRENVSPVPAEPAQVLFRGLLMYLDAESDASAMSSRGTELHHRQVVQTLAMRITERPGKDYAIAELAREAGYSPGHFSRVFKQVFGISPQMYVIRARIDRAKQLLVESSLSISQIADVLGYEDLYFFSRQFKSQTGRAPAHYRSGTSSQAGKFS